MDVENVIIIGSGPAGYTAAIYLAREEFKPLIICGIAAGGQLMLTNEVENYPGFPDGALGPDMMELFKKQAERFGARFVYDNVTAVDFTKRPFKVSIADQDYFADSIIISTGASSKWLGIESEQKLIGKGISSCATCLPPGSFIVANASVNKIDEITSETRVMTHDGTFEQVSELTKRHYSGKLIKFKTRFFRSETTSLTPNHPLLVRTLKKGKGINYRDIEWSNPFWIPAGKLNTSHILLYPVVKQEIEAESIDLTKELGLAAYKGKVKFEIETHTSHRIKRFIKIDSQFARLIGYYLSEGFAHSRGISFAFNINEKEYVEDCVNLLKKKFDIVPSVKNDGSVTRITLNSKILSMLFEKLFGKYSHTKKLPHKFILFNKKLQKEIIKGLWRGDGTDRKKDFVITTSSRELVEQVKIMLLRQGILPGVEKRKFETLRFSKIYGRKVEFKRDVYQLLIGGPWLEKMSKVLDVYHPLLDRRKHISNHGWIDHDYAMLPIRSIIQEQYDGFVYNIAVEKNNTYVTTNSIVHNCDAPFFRNKNVVVVGGGDTAMEDSLFLTKFANSVTILHRKSEFRASKIMQGRVLSNPKIKVIFNTTIDEVLGKDKVTGIKIKNVQTNKIQEMIIDGLFVAIGHQPNTDFLKGKIALDDMGYIITKDEVKTQIEGLYAAGDVVDRVYRQAITAAGSGAKAALEVRSYLQELKYKQKS